MRTGHSSPAPAGGSYLSHIDDVEFSEDSFLLLLLLPLVFVAWADGQVQSRERRLIQAIARGAEFLPGDTAAVLGDWLEHRPTAAEFGQGFRRLTEFLQRRERASAVHAGLRDHLEEFCVRVVAHRGGGSPVPTITDAEGDALDEVQALLWLAQRPSWEELDAWLDGSIERLSGED